MINISQQFPQTGRSAKTELSRGIFPRTELIFAGSPPEISVSWEE